MIKFPLKPIEELELSLNEVQKNSRIELANHIQHGEYSIQEILNCPFCGTSNPDIIAVNDRHGLPVKAQLCRNCGLIWSTPILSDESLPAYYNHIYHRLNYGKEETIEHLFNPRQGELIFGFLREFLQKNNQIIICEIGCGACDILHYFQNCFSERNINTQIYGTEFSKSYIASAKEKYGVDVFQGGIHTLIDHGIKSDLLIYSHVFEHIIDLKSELQLIKQVLSPKGLLYIEVPGVIDILHNNPYYQFRFDNFHTLAHIYNFNLGTLKNVLGNAGFLLIKGNEKVQALFSVAEETETSSPLSYNNEYMRIKSYLQHSLPYICENDNEQKAFLKTSYRNFSEYEKNTIILQKDKIIFEKNKLISQKDIIIAEKDKLLNRKKQCLKNLEASLHRVMKSNSYKIGRIITWPLRGLRRNNELK